MSDRKTSGANDQEKEYTYYTLNLELDGVDPRKVTKVQVWNHSLRSGFLVIECKHSEHWYRVSDVRELQKVC